MGYDFTGGRISHFPIDFCMGLTTVQRKGAAFDKASDHIDKLLSTEATLGSCLL